LAIERARDAMRRESHLYGSASEFWAPFWKSVDTFYTKDKIEPISYDSYKKSIFEPSLSKIAEATTGSTPSIDDILRPRGQTKPAPSPFKAARILSLMNKFPDEKSHQDLYVAALD
jgi:hypothetical protein